MDQDKKQEIGHWWEFADAAGIETKYRENQANADRELAEATAGPNDQGHVAADDTGMKNPYGEFQCPSAKAVTPPNARATNKAADKDKIDGAVTYSGD